MRRQADDGMTDWRDISRCLRAQGPASWMDAEALAFLARIGPLQPVIVACSGGADSVLLLLTALDLIGSERVQVNHYHHGLRGSEADEDAAFVQQMCEELGICFCAGRRQAEEDVSEAALRSARYQWLVDQYHSRDAGALLLGHHADDLLETQLMNLLAGTGPAGLCAPLPVHPFADGHVRVRPLLSVKRSFIEQTLRSLNAPWREDSSNRDIRYTRNWIRRELVPKLVDRFPQDIHAGSARTCKLQREAVDALDEVAGGLRVDLSNAAGFDANPLRDCSPAIIRRILYAWWMRHYGEVILPTRAADRVVECLACWEQPMKVSIGPLPGIDEAVYCIRMGTDGHLELVRESRGGTVSWNGGCHWNWRAGPVFLPAGASLSGEEIAWPAGELPYREANPAREAWLSTQSGSLEVRQWQFGDRYRPLGAPGSRKLQDIFCDAKLNSEQKQALPVILNNKGEILWVPGFPPAESAKVTAGANSALRLTYRMHSTAF